MENKLTNTIALMTVLCSGTYGAIITDTAAGIPFFTTNWDTTGVTYSVPATGSLELDLFDDNGGAWVLSQVKITATAGLRGEVEFVNVNNSQSTEYSGTVSGTVNVEGTVGAFNVSISPVSSVTIPTSTLGPLDSTVTTIGGGPSGAGVFDTAVVTYTNPATLANFIGTGTFTLDATGVGAATISSSGGSFGSSPELEALAGAVVEYTYNPVPEPSTYMLFGGLTVAALLIIRRRRRS